MAHSLYITGTEGSSGKTVVTLGLMHFLQSQVRKVAFFRPIIDSEDEARRDSSINLILKHFELDMLYRDTYACTYKEALELVTSGNMSLLIEKIFQKYKALENEYDFVLCQGTDFRDKDTAVQFELNSEIAASLNIPLALVINGKDKSLDAIQASVRSNLELLKDKRREVGCVFVNRVSFTTEDCPTCADVYMGRIQLGKKVIIVGGSETGMETAMYLCEEGHDVVVLTRQNRLARDASGLHYITMAWLKPLKNGYGLETNAWEKYDNLKGITNASTKSIKNGVVTYVDKYGHEHSITADSVVICGGTAPLLQEAMAYSDAADRFFAVGDCNHGGNIQRCTRDAFAAACSL